MTHEIFVPQHVSVCAPAVRMLALFAACDDDGTVDHEVLPVVALRSTLGTLYASDAEPPEVPTIGASATEMPEHGWRFVETEAREDPLVLDEASRVIAVRDYDMHDGNVKAVIAAPWPPDEDERRLRKTLADLKSRARREAGEIDAYALACGAPEQRHFESTRIPTLAH